MKSGAGTDEVHTPKLWYYEMLSFLEDQTVPRTSQTTGSVLDSMPFGYDEDCEDDFNESTSVPSTSSCAAMLEDSSEGQITPRFKRPRSQASQTIDNISMRMDQLLEKQIHPSIKTMEEHEMFGAYVGQKAEILATK
ncbi:hypothetical protein AVEN_77229-1 [Araneus ventricosus]|uniref:MADF domain-containing protein n=1 Tax=Araneus ventricosus TaxID=182803 RepID=A0A4Y2QM13_ARAVE|nr:hypothetical protein AVEN_77229-1 [Araneus ventricosus]